MKNYLLALSTLVVSLLLSSAAHAQTAAFTYQGQLNSGGALYTGNAEFQATLWNAASDGSQIAANVPAQVIVAVSNGLFTLPLDFGANFPGADRWLQLEVRTNISSFTTLTPRQQITPTPYAITASNLSGSLPAAQLSGNIGSANLSGTYSGAVTLNNSTNSFSGNGAGLTALNADNLASGTVPDARLAGNVARTNGVWTSTGNSGTTAGTDFVGTTDNEPLEIKVNGLRALRLEPNPDEFSHSNTVNMVGGSSVNTVGAGTFGATIAGGGALRYFGTARTNRVDANFGTVSGGALNIIQTNAIHGTIGGGYANTIQSGAEYATISGGFLHTVQTNATHATIGGGSGNIIQSNATYSTIAGGRGNTIRTNANHATVAGGFSNTINSNATFATISGGSQNTIRTNANSSTIAGGSLNTIQGDADYASIPGGENNSATNYAFAAGRRAKANHTGAFVWGDSTDADVTSTAADQFTIRAGNGVRLTEEAVNKPIAVGEHYRDNAIVAWGRCSSTGSVTGSAFGVSSVTKTATGHYDVVVTATALGSTTLIPVAIAEVESQPTSAATARIVTVNQTGSSTFSVFINTGAFAAVDNDFVFMVTAR